MKHKVIINKCYGGVYGLSEVAVKWLYENGTPYMKKYIEEKRKEISKDDYYKRYDVDRVVAADIYYDFPRHNLDIVRCVETIGEKANGEYANLVIVEIEGNRYKIEEYDGFERIILPKDEEYITIEEEER